MSSFGTCQRLEKEGVAEVVRFLRAVNSFPDFCLTPKDEKQALTQRTFGDAIGTAQDGKTQWIDFKIEQSNRYHNFFIEEWSNRSRGNPGWLHKINCHVIMYYFYEEKDLYRFEKEELLNWAFHGKSRSDPENLYRILDFPLKPQSKYKQKNDTWGFCVPTRTILQEVPGAKHKNIKAFLEENAEAD